MPNWKHFQSTLDHQVIICLSRLFSILTRRPQNETIYLKKKKTAGDLVFSMRPMDSDFWVSTYLCVRSTRKSPVVPIVTGGVLKTETCFVAFSHSPLCAGVQQVIVAEFIHAVVMSNVPHNKAVVASYT
jgi:hypothetical protein